MNNKSLFNNYYNYKFQGSHIYLRWMPWSVRNDPIFYYDVISNNFYHIYYDGMFFNQNNSNYFCEELRFIIDPKFKNRFINEFNENYLEMITKKKLKSIYNSKIN